MKNLKLTGSAFLRISGLIIVLGLLLRIVLLFNPTTVVDYSFTEWIQIFILGTFNDLFFATLSFSFFWVFLLFFSKDKYNKPWTFIIYGLLGVTFIVLQFFNTPLKEFNAALTRVISYIILYRIISYSIRLLVPSIRNTWRQYTYYILFFIYVLLIVLNAFAEYFFWSEFGLRYNFIAVDYLVYTNEVIGNFFESYPMIPLISIVVLLAVVASIFLLHDIKKNYFKNTITIRNKIIITFVYGILCIASYALLSFNFSFQHNTNSFVNELQANGCVKFCQAFLNNDLSYKDFYTKIPNKEANKIMSKDDGWLILKNEEYCHDCKNSVDACDN